MYLDRNPAAADGSVVVTGVHQGFVVRLGSDTLAVERYVRLKNRISGELWDYRTGRRWTYDVTLGDNGLVSKFESALFRLQSRRGSKPIQQVTVVFEQGTASLRTTGPPRRVHTITAPLGAIPYLDPSFALVEQLLRQSLNARDAKDRSSIVLTPDGATRQVTVAPLLPDSALVTIAGVETRLHVDANARVLGGEIPSQDVMLDTLSLPLISDKDVDAVVPDVAYATNEVTIEASPEHRLAGTLTLPSARSGRAPAVVLISGSGLQSRDGEIRGVRGYRPFQQLADTLSRRGIAVLRMDDRGYGGSVGRSGNVTAVDEVADIKAALRYLRDRPDIDPNGIGLIGHSQGSTVSSMVALEDTVLRAIVLLAAPSRPGREILAYQQRALIEEQTSLSESARDSVARIWQQVTDSLAVRDPWLGFFLAYEPLSDAEKLRVPVLMIHGKTDHQVPYGQSGELYSAIRGSGNRDVTLRLFEGLDHLLLQDDHGKVAEYGSRPSKRVSPQVLGVVADWLAKRLNS